MTLFFCPRLLKAFVLWLMQNYTDPAKMYEIDGFVRQCLRKMPRLSAPNNGHGDCHIEANTMRLEFE
jgi:hypothetical protein